MRRTIKLGCGLPLLALAVLALGVFAIVFVQGRRTPTGDPAYVALGSSFAAGAALGPLQDGSPTLCARSTGGYPQQLAHLRKVPIVDVTCGGATAAQVVGGGQFFQRPQVRAIDARTRLVTLTAGGNDIGYIGDLSLLAERRSPGLFGWGVRRFWSGPEPAAARDYAGVGARILAAIRIARLRAPRARVVVATYPAILPPNGTCARLRMSAADADLMRQVAERLRAVTASAARRGGALLVDMQQLGAAHHACSAEPWTRGWTTPLAGPFHPSAAGAAATARAIDAALSLPAAVAPVGEHDTAGHQARRVGR